MSHEKPDEEKVCKKVFFYHKKLFGGDWVEKLTINSKFKVLKYACI